MLAVLLLIRVRHVSLREIQLNSCHRKKNTKQSRSVPISSTKAQSDTCRFPHQYDCDGWKLLPSGSCVFSLFCWSIHQPLLLHSFPAPSSHFPAHTHTHFFLLAVRSISFRQWIVLKNKYTFVKHLISYLLSTSTSYHCATFGAATHPQHNHIVQRLDMISYGATSLCCWKHSQLPQLS